ncbi:MAG: CRISPR-associated endonuclease Cas1 [Armatimonadota bacterium]
MRVALPDYLPVSAVAEVAYCPRNFYYRMVEQWEDTNVHVLKGKLEDEKRNKRKLLHRDDARHIRSVMASSDRLGLIAVVDAIQENTDLCPLEYKKGPLTESLHDDVQLCAEAMILEEVLNHPLDRGFIYYAASRRRRAVDFTPELRREVEHFIEQALDILVSGEVPDPVADERCEGCSLAPGCLPHEVGVIEGRERPPLRPMAPIRLGRVMYIDEQGAYVRKSGGRIIVTKRGETIASVPAANVDQLVLVGAAQVSSQAVRWLLRMNVEVLYLSYYGRFEGRFVPETHGNVVLRLKQYQAHFDSHFCLSASREFVRGKLSNLRTLLLRQNRTLGSAEVRGAADEIASAIAQIASAGDLDELRATEARGSKAYFQAFGHLIKAEDADFDFKRRDRRPPPDPVNALLGFAYAMLCADAVSACSLAGLDPYVGFFHRPRYGRPSLALDLMEEFRPIIADSVVLTLLNKRMIRPHHFVRRLRGCFLTEKGREPFFRAYSQRKRQEIKHPLFGYRLSYLRTLEIQARLLAKVLTGDIQKYEPFVVR